MSVVVTGAAGQLGRLTAAKLLERVAPSDLILVTRQPGALADLAARGIRVRRGDFDDPASLPAAFAGGERLLLISTTAIGRRVPQHRAAIAAAQGAGVRHVVYTSAIHLPLGHPTGMVGKEHLKTEAALRESGLAWTLLRNSLYAELLLTTAPQAVASGRLVTNAGDGRIAYVAREDCAAVAAAVLTTDGHEGQTYDVTGPELVDQSGVAAALSEVSGRPVTVVPVDDESYVQSLIGGGLPEPYARAFAGFGVAIREGHLDRLSPAVPDLTGLPGRTLSDVLASNRAALFPGL